MSGRKANSRSSIYLGKDGSWHGRVTMGVRDNGAPDRRHVRGKSEKDVTSKVQDLERKRDAGNVDKPGTPPTVAAWLTMWLETIAPRTARRSTIDSTYRPKVVNWIIPQLGRHRLDRLQPEHVDALYTWLADQGLAPNTIVQVHRVLSRALKVATMRGRVARNVCTLVDAPSAVEVELEPLTAGEARRVLAAAADLRNGCRWSVALALGLRQCEALGLRWKYIDLNSGEMRVWWQIRRVRYRHGCEDPHACGRTYHREPCPPGCTKHKGECPAPCRKGCEAHARSCPRRNGGGYEFREPKGRGRRVIALPRPLLATLKAHRAAQLHERMAAGSLWEDWDLVFCQPTGQPIETHDDWEQWRDLLEAAGLRHVRVHDARHTAATLLLEQGVDVRVVQEILGHSTITMTRRYTHVTSRLAQDAAGRMAKALWDAN